MEAPSASGTPDRGVAGASAQRRHERLRERRVQRSRERFGRLSRLHLALTSEPQSTRAWATGSRGERLLGAYLDTIHDEQTVIVLHDRRIPGSRANIDHIAISRSGSVWTIDAKNYAGQVQLADKGGLFRTDSRLYVGRRDCTTLIQGMATQTGAIRVALGQPLVEEFALDIRAALCFVQADWPLLARPFTLDGVWVGWPKALGKLLCAEGSLGPEHLNTLARRVAAALPPA